MLKIDRDFQKWVSPSNKPKAKRRFAEARGSTAAEYNRRIELAALIGADEKLEGAQDYLRGGTRLKHIRAAIRERIKQLEAKP